MIREEDCWTHQDPETLLRTDAYNAPPLEPSPQHMFVYLSTPGPAPAAVSLRIASPLFEPGEHGRRHGDDVGQSTGFLAVSTHLRLATGPGEETMERIHLAIG